MANTAETGIFGLTAIGEWTATSVTAGGTSTSEYNDDNVYTLVPWGHVTDAGVVESGSVTRLEIGAATTAAIVHTFITSASRQIAFGLTSGTLTNIRRMLGLPTAALTGDLSAGTPTKEILQVAGADLGSVEYQLYYQTAGFLGPRFVFMPRARIADFGQLVYGRTDVAKPSATFGLQEGLDGNLLWIEDEEA